MMDQLVSKVYNYVRVFVQLAVVKAFAHTVIMLYLPKINIPRYNI